MFICYIYLQPITPEVCKYIISNRPVSRRQFIISQYVPNFRIQENQLPQALLWLTKMSKVAMCFHHLQITPKAKIKMTLKMLKWASFHQFLEHCFLQNSHYVNIFCIDFLPTALK